MRKGLATDIKHVLKETEFLRIRVQKLMKEMMDSKSLLSGLTMKLWGDEASALIMSSLQS